MKAVDFADQGADQCVCVGGEGGECEGAFCLGEEGVGGVEGLSHVGRGRMWRGE